MVGFIYYNAPIIGKNIKIYKIGPTNDFNRRINEYPYETQIIYVTSAENDTKCKRELVKEFKSEFDWRNDVGNEYFEGNERDMISVFNHYCTDHLPNKDEDINIDYHWQIEDSRLNTERNQRRFKKYK
jgi:hypothetical protein